MTPTAGSLLKEVALDRTQFLSLVELAIELKQLRHSGTEPPMLPGRHIALLFEKNSTRTRCAFEVAAGDEGARVTFIGPDGSHVGREESVADTARVLGRLYDGVAYRGFAQQTIEEFAERAGVPVWNALSNEWHPTQMLADVMTMVQHHGEGTADPADITLCFTGDGRNNVARSLLVTGALLGMDVRIAAPPDLQPPDDVRALAAALARDSGARVTVTADAPAAVEGADFIYTDVWLSMGEPEAAWGERIVELQPYRVTAALMATSGKPGTKFLHCLPSLHNRKTVLGAQLHERFELGPQDGLEVTEDVFESPASIVFDQAENRMHTIKAVLVSAFR
jgi:ornithine carbamoyltransferase